MAINGVVTTDLGGTDSGYSLALQKDGKILVAGDTVNSNGDNDYNFALVRYNKNGSLDTSFGNGGEVITDFGHTYDYGRSVVVQADGKILMAGYSNAKGSNYDFTVVRYNSDGSLDTSFGSGGKVFTPVGSRDDYAYAITLQKDNKILVAGTALGSDGTKDFALLRYNSDGSLDASFSADGKVTAAITDEIPINSNISYVPPYNEVAYSLTAQTDGKILLSGSCSNVAIAVMRFNSDGTLDNSFSNDGKVAFSIASQGSSSHAVTTQQNGKILVAGSYEKVGYGGFVVARFNTDGSLDKSFSNDGIATFDPSDAGLPSVYTSGSAESIIVQPNGRILVTGHMTVWTGGGNYLTEDFFLVRLNSDGSLDTSFSGDGVVITNLGANDEAYSASLQADGKILVAGKSNGDFVLARYNADGSLDNTFSPGVVLNGSAGDDVLNGGSGNDTLNGNAGNDTLNGDSGMDALDGGAGDDLLNGGADADSLKGGSGDDTYVIDNPGDSVTEYAGGGVDTVVSTVGYSLGANLENLTLTGIAAINGTGNELANTLTGNIASNTLIGGAGDDLLDGGLGADTLKGGPGNDTYIVDNAADKVSENAGEGVDTVQSSVSWTLGANLENLTLIGSKAVNGSGNELANILTGNSAANTLDGSTGADRLVGGGGNDLYLVDNSGDSVIENANEGVDTVKASVSYALPANVENLALTGADAINGYGNELANILSGNAANNLLDGGLGADILQGGAGDDTYVVDNRNDSVRESIGGGADTVKASISYALPANVENLTLTGADAINGNGNDLANTLTGNNAANVLNGGLGNDRLDGGAGVDTLAGGVGSDTFAFSTTAGGADRTTDFASGVDRLQLLDGAANLNIGNGDHAIDNAALVNTHGGFSNLAELVIVTPDISGALTAAKAAADIGSAASAYAVGDVRVFAVDNGTDSALYLFKSAGTDTEVSAAELTLVGTLQGTAQTALADYAFA